jgi:4-deoxy-L-threo-5-hexosulose-uronate ketol-isomerase
MKQAMIKHDIRYATNPDAIKSQTTNELRQQFLIDDIFQDDLIRICYTHYDRFVAGGAKPLKQPLSLQPIDALKATYFLERRELGIINVGGPGKVTVDGQSYDIAHKEALYVGRGQQNIVFHPGDESLYYFNSAPAHAVHPTRLITGKEAEKVELGSLETSNHRTIHKLIVNSVVTTCQLQMGLTELKVGSVWNTMPAHVHDRRMEVYFYFDLPDKQVVSHFMGMPNETRHLFVHNHQAVISPPWSIHCGAGTSNYTFIWGMAGENLDYGDMDVAAPVDLR